MLILGEADIAWENWALIIMVSDEFALLFLNDGRLWDKITDGPGQVLHNGLFEFVREDPEAKSLGSDEILETHQVDKSWLNEDAPLNIPGIPVTFEVFQLLISWLKLLFLNI